MRLDLVQGISRLPQASRQVATWLVEDAAGADGALSHTELDAYIAAHPNAATRSRAVLTLLSAQFARSSESITVIPLASTSRARLAPARAPVSLDFAPVEGTHVRLSAVGDLLLHDSLQRAAESLGGFSPLLSRVTDRLRRADVTMANLETPVARDTLPGGATRVLAEGDLYDGTVYSGYPAFNAHPSFAGAVAASGIDVVTTANNHGLDRGANGVDRTLAALDAEGIQHVGSHATTDVSTDRFVIRNVNGMRVAFLAYTFSTNGIPDKQHQVAYLERQQALADVRALRARADVDAVIVAPHWGIEYVPRQPTANERLARELIDAGADLVIGAHPHVLQPLERHTAPDGHEGLIAYSLGNFIAGQTRAQTNESAILHVDLVKPTGGGRVRISGVSYDRVDITPRFFPEIDGRVQVPTLDATGAAADNIDAALGVAPGSS